MVDGNAIAAIARANLGKMYDSVNSAGGMGYYTSTTGGSVRSSALSHFRW